MRIENLDTVTASKIYLLLTMLNGTLYAIAELEPDKMKGQNKVRFLNIRSNIRNFMYTISNSATAADKELLHSYTFDSIGLMAEVFALLSYVPENQIDWMSQEINKLVIQSFKNLEHEN
jgi:hypothetical protein